MVLGILFFLKWPLQQDCTFTVSLSQLPFGRRRCAKDLSVCYVRSRGMKHLLFVRSVWDCAWLSDWILYLVVQHIWVLQYLWAWNHLQKGPPMCCWHVKVHSSLSSWGQWWGQFLCFLAGLSKQMVTYFPSGEIGQPRTSTCALVNVFVSRPWEGCFPHSLWFVTSWGERGALVTF